MVFVFCKFLVNNFKVVFLVLVFFYFKIILCIKVVNEFEFLILDVLILVCFNFKVLLKILILFLIILLNFSKLCLVKM